MASEIPDPLEQLTLEQLRTRSSMKWRAFPPDMLPVWVAEMDVTPAEPVARAIHDAVSQGDTGYPAGRPLAEAIAGFAAERWDWPDFPVGRTASVVDVMTGVVEVLERITEPGSPVVVTSPVYPPFFAFIAAAGRRYIEAPLSPEGRIDPDTLAEALGRARESGKPPALLLANPHNPTGVTHTRAELEQVAALAAEHGARVVADEIHAPLAMPGESFTPYLRVAGAESGFSIMAAIIVAGPEAEADLAAIPEVVSHGPSHIGMLAQAAAFREGGPWLDALIAGLDSNRRLLADLLARQLPAVGYRMPQATYLAWLDCRALGLGGGDATAEPGLVTLDAGPAAEFRRVGRVVFNAGEAFGTGGAGHVRLNMATSSQIITEAVARMERTVAEVGAARG